MGLGRGSSGLRRVPLLACPAVLTALLGKPAVAPDPPPVDHLPKQRQKIVRKSIPSVRRSCGLLCVMVLSSLLGCGHGGRVSVEGTVTLDGRPLEKGQIQFSPLPGSTGPTAGADIVNGKFAIPPSDGPFAGNFRVQVSQVGLTGRKVLDPRSNSMVDEYAQILPARYNKESRLEAKVTASGPNRLKFALTSQ